MMMISPLNHPRSTEPQTEFKAEAPPITRDQAAFLYSKRQAVETMEMWPSNMGAAQS